MIDYLQAVRSPTIEALTLSLGQGEGVRASFTAELEQYYDILIEALESGDFARFNPMMDRWIEARTESEIASQVSSLAVMLREMLIQSMQVARNYLSGNEAFAIAEALAPVYTYLTEYVTRKETGIHIEHFSNELAMAQVTLERLDRSKSEFISIAAHELKTPLTLIDGYTAMLKEQIESDYKDSLQLLGGIERGTHRLREIIDDMLDVSLIDNDLLSLNFQPVWISHIMGILRREIAGYAAGRNIEMQFLPIPGADEMIYGDGERLYQAFRNVISNAIKFTPDGGKVVIDGRKLPGFIEITVTDTGIGLNPEDQDRIFEKFGQIGNVSLHSSSKIKFKGGGPGLGLPIAKGIFEAHGGAIWVESEGYDEVNCPGSTFHILLPLRKESPDAKIAKLFGAEMEQAGSLKQFIKFEKDR